MWREASSSGRSVMMGGLLSVPGRRRPLGPEPGLSGGRPVAVRRVADAKEGARGGTMGSPTRTRSSCGASPPPPSRPRDRERLSSVPGRRRPSGPEPGCARREPRCRCWRVADAKEGARGGNHGFPHGSWGSRRRATRPRPRSSPTTDACSRPWCRRRRSCTRASAGSSPRSPRGATSSSSRRSSETRSTAAGESLDRRRPDRRHAGPGPRRRPARRRVGGQGDRLVPAAAAGRGRPPRRAPRLAVSRAGPVEPPFTCLLASGGHTLLLAVRRARPFRAARHDARRRRGRGVRQGRPAARSRLSGRPAIDALARDGDPDAFAFPRRDVRRARLLLLGAQDRAPVHGSRPRGRGGRSAARPISQRATSTRSSARSSGVCDAAAEQTGLERIAVVGGVAANSSLRAALPDAAFAPLALCTDNAAMIASAARFVEPLPYPRYLELDAYASVA